MGRRAADTSRRAHSTASECDSVEEGLARLSVDGFCVMRGSVRMSDVEAALAAAERLGLPPTAAAPANEKWVESSFGRYHRVNFLGDDVTAFAALETSLAPLARAFFQSVDGNSFYRSELQLVTATPSSENQIWHSDNRADGLTLLVPLVDFTLQNGATQVLPGTHKHGAAMVASSHAGATVACVRRGDVIAMNSRTYHRGLGNASTEPRPALVLRYDEHATPPPGVGCVGTTLNRLLAELTNIATFAGMCIIDRR